MTDGEIEVIRAAIKKLRGNDRASEEVNEALTGPARLYLETWVIKPLELLLPGPTRNVKLAKDLSR